MFVNDFLKLKKEKEKEKEDSIIKNDDLFEEEDLESDDEQIILNEERDEECSFFSDNAENELNKLNIISNKEILPNNNKNEKNLSDNINNVKEIKAEIKIINEGNKKSDENLLNNEEKYKKLSEEINIKVIKDIKENNQENKIGNEAQVQNNQNKNSKNYFSKKVLYKKNKGKNDNKKIIESSNKNNTKNNNIEKKSTHENMIKKTKSKEKSLKKLTTEKRKNSKNSYINKMKEKKNMKIKYENHSKLWKNSKREDEGSKSCLLNEKNKISLKNEEVSYDKYGNKTIIKKKEINNLKQKNNSTKNNRNLIKVDKKMNRSYDSKFTNKKNINNINTNNNSPNKIKHHTYNSKSPKNDHKIISFTNLKKEKDVYNTNNISKSTVLLTKNSIKKPLKEKEKKDNKDNHADGLKKILMNKINNQISQIIQKKEKMFFNENNKLFFLGFCDILFELGFLHIKETEIKDISTIQNHINDLYTQPFTNRTLLSENFLFNEQKLLICAWKTILNNFILIKEFDSLPEESEEITLDDCKLFIFIITGLFIGFNNKCLSEKFQIKSERKPLKNKSLKNFRKVNYNKEIFNDVKLNQSYTKTFNDSKNKYHFRKKGESNNMMDSNNDSYNSNNISNENILKNILENRKKSDYNYKSILKIKNYFTYFAELRKLYNLYKKDLKNINQKKAIEKDFTFKPKTNKNNKVILNKFSPKMDFFQRNDLIKKRNEKKIIILQKERSQKLLKECTFDPLKSNNKKIEQLNPKEISNRLYHNHYNSNKSLNNSNLNSTCKHTEKIISEKKFSETYQFIPNTNKKFNRDMFIKSPLDKDELLNKRIKDLREVNLDRIITNYEKNSREVLSNDLKKDKNLLKEIISQEKGGMKMGIEKKTCKDTFDNFQNFNFYDLPRLNNYLYGNNIKEPLFSVEIKIKQNIKTIEVYQNDVPEKIAYDFCVENMLGKGSYEKIVNIIKDKLDEISKGNFDENVVIDNNGSGNGNDLNNINNIKEDLDNKVELNEKVKDNEEIKENSNIKENANVNNKENINEDINIDNNEIINMNIDLNDFKINKENKENEENINNINEENNIKDEYLHNSDDFNSDNSNEKIKNEIKQEEMNQNQINDENNINKNYDDEEEKKDETDENNYV